MCARSARPVGARANRFVQKLFLRFSTVALMLFAIKIRVLRSWKAKEFGPKEKGYRYDGLYKVSDFWFDIGKSGKCYTPV